MCIYRVPIYVYNTLFDHRVDFDAVLGSFA